MQAHAHRLQPQSSKTQLGPAPLPTKELSARETLDLTFQRERLEKLLRDGELLPLLKQHFNETDPDKDRAFVDVNWDYYLAADRTGSLVVNTARDGSALVGYVFTFVGPHHHKQGVLVGSITMYWLHPANRLGLAGYKLLRDNEKVLKELGVQKILASSMVSKHTWVLFARMGYNAEEILYGKWLIP
jgi:hypothetical protein